MEILSTSLGVFNYSGKTHILRPYSDDDTISNLKFISKIREGDKIDSKRLCIQPKGIITSLCRTFYYQDNRDNTFTFIINTINHSFNIIELNLSTDDKKKHSMALCVMSDIDNAMRGINNVKKTYIYDSMFCSKIERLLQEITVKLNIVKEKAVSIMNEDDTVTEDFSNNEKYNENEENNL